MKKYSVEDLWQRIRSKMDKDDSDVFEIIAPFFEKIVADLPESMDDVWDKTASLELLLKTRITILETASKKEKKEIFTEMIKKEVGQDLTEEELEEINQEFDFMAKAIVDLNTFLKEKSLDGMSMEEFFEFEAGFSKEKIEKIKAGELLVIDLAYELLS